MNLEMNSWCALVAPGVMGKATPRTARTAERGKRTPR
jgi:hypothetical protein